MIVLGAGMNKINNELRRTQYELTLPEHFALFASFAVHDFFHHLERKGRKDSLIGLYAINHREYRGHREKWQSIVIPVMTYETATASRFRTRMTRIARIFTDILDQFASPFHSTDNKPQRSQRTQSRMGKLCALCVLYDGLALFTSWLTRIFTNPCASVSSVLSVFYCHTSAFICVHLRLISVSLRDRAQKIKGEI